MATERQRELFLGVLLVILAIVGYRAYSTISGVPAAAVDTTTASTQPGAVRRGANPSRIPSAANRTTAEAFDVHLDALEQERPKPGRATRNLFRFKPPPPPPAPARPALVAPAPLHRPTRPPPP